MTDFDDLEVKVFGLSDKITELEMRFSNIDHQINILNKESIETNIIVKKSLDAWLEENGQRIILEHVRKIDRNTLKDIHFEELEKKLDAGSASLKESLDRQTDAKIKILNLMDGHTERIDNLESVLQKFINFHWTLETQGQTHEKDLTWDEKYDKHAELSKKLSGGKTVASVSNIEERKEVLTEHEGLNPTNSKPDIYFKYLEDDEIVVKREDLAKWKRMLRYLLVENKSEYIRVQHLDEIIKEIAEHRIK